MGSKRVFLVNEEIMKEWGQKRRERIRELEASGFCPERNEIEGWGKKEKGTRGFLKQSKLGFLGVNRF